MKTKKYLIFLCLFCILFWLIVFFPIEIKIKGNVILEKIINNPIWQYIVIGIVIFIFGKKYIDNEF